ncbi:hypothetical protein [Desulfocucumis palustris]|uniref:hypothetical protein n=1 Tax=Desulfocucumis palustris TaxID=1898651 RepID=UPI000CEA3D4C|nr:hypothetical protein [Desulfocucumis palustris]
MLNWRITKYNPSFRDYNGVYNLNEWTSFGDVGKSFDGKILTIDEYLSIENAYINAVLAFMEDLKITSLKVRGVEKYDEYLRLNKTSIEYPNDMVNLFSKVCDNCTIEMDKVENLCRLVLREHMWCKLENGSLIFVHFGHDYYMYIGSTRKCNNAIEKIKKSGLFVEEYKSPYKESSL